MNLSRLKGLEDRDLLRRLRTVEAVDGVCAFIGGRRYTLFCTNDYLGLSSHPAVISAANEATQLLGAGAGSASLITGHTIRHELLEEELASFKSAGAAMLFGSGYLANSGAIPAIAGEDWVILSDELNHASLIDGCRLSKADVKIYRHCDMSSLESSLKESTGASGRLIVTEGVFSMDGDIAPLPEIIGLANSYDAFVYLDEAHATGVIGNTGRGSAESFGIGPGDVERLVQMGTLGKALGSYGAFIAAGNGTVSWLVNTARSFIFSTALPPSACSAASASLKVIIDEPWRLANLKENSERLRIGLINMGYTVSGGGTPIIPVIVGGAGEALKLSVMLADAGFFAPAIRPPTVPEGASRIRLTVSALHTASEIDSLLDVFRKS